MIKSLANLVVRVVDLAEAELRAARRGVIRMGIGLLLVAAALAAGLIAAFAVLGVIYLGLRAMEVAQWKALLIVALLLFGITAACGVTAHLFLDDDDSAGSR